MKNILLRYRRLLEDIDLWFEDLQEMHPGKIMCKRGCADCCSGLFEINIIDALLLQEGLKNASEKIQKKILHNSLKIQQDFKNTQLGAVYNYPLFNFTEVFDEDPATLIPHQKCALLSNNECMLYDYRPMRCRLQGIPIIDQNGDVINSTLCEKNFNGLKGEDITENVEYNFTALLLEEDKILDDLGGFFDNKNISEVFTFVFSCLLNDPIEFLQSKEGEEWYNK